MSGQHATGNLKQRELHGMGRYRFRIPLLSGAVLFAMLVHGQAQTLPMEPTHQQGSSVTGAYEGWFRNPDGTFSLLLGYFNRNATQDIDIPIGPENKIEPGGPDRGQPTHFSVGRQYGLFAVKVPADFGTNKITWTIVANGKTTVIPASLHVDYEISPWLEVMGNTPPLLRFGRNDASVQGPQGFSAERTATVGSPLALDTWVSDDAKLSTTSGARPKNLGPPATVLWTKYRGPGTVKFENQKPPVQKVEGYEPGAKFSGKAVTTATFNQPGEYVLHVVVNDWSEVGFQCCWTNGTVKVLVKP
jgi:hypothetical protein